MGINFPDLQVLLPRTEELARAGSPGQQQDVNQQALAQAALAQTERDRTRVARARRSERSARTRKEKRDEQRTAPRQHPRGKGARIDVEA